MAIRFEVHLTDGKVIHVDGADSYDSDRHFGSTEKVYYVFKKGDRAIAWAKRDLVVAIVEREMPR